MCNVFLHLYNLENSTQPITQNAICLDNKFTNLQTYGNCLVVSGFNFRRDVYKPQSPGNDTWHPLLEIRPIEVGTSIIRMCN